MRPIENLNWKEWQEVASHLQKESQNLYSVTQVLVPERPEFPEGFLKNEWQIKLGSRTKEAVFGFSLRPTELFTQFTTEKSQFRRASAKATHSPLSLALSKFLKGSKWLGVENPPQERCLILWFSQGAAKGKGQVPKVGLVLLMIPSRPEAYLINEDFEILAQNRGTHDQKSFGKFKLGENLKVPEGLTVRPEWVASLEIYRARVEAGLKEIALEQRTARVQRALKEQLGLLKERIRVSEVALASAKKEPDWKEWGDLLMGVLTDPPPLLGPKRNIRRIPHYETGEIIEVVCDPKLTAKQQAQRFYANLKRKERRILEAESRIELAREKIEKLESNPTEEALGLVESPAQEGGPKRKQHQWAGRIFYSKDGLSIWVGKQKEENLELTFKYAKGNDLWLHLRGKPGSHAVVPLSPGKSASLETLLDAAHLVIFYSGGENWGKAEVDYTHKKYVKRIKNSDLVSYTNNKTLNIKIDPLRLKRLLGDKF